MGHRSTCACFDTPVFAVAPLLCHVAECVDNERHVVGRLAPVALAIVTDDAPAKAHPTTCFAHPPSAELRIGFAFACPSGTYASYALMEVATPAPRSPVEVISVQGEGPTTTVAFSQDAGGHHNTPQNDSNSTRPTSSNPSNVLYRCRSAHAECTNISICLLVCPGSLIKMPLSFGFS